MRNGTISLMSQIASLFTNNGRRPVFDKMFESGKRLECFPNDA